MNGVRLVALALGFLAFLSSVWLLFENRESERVLGNTIPAFFIATIGILATLLFSLRGERQENRFPSQFVIDLEKMTPFYCEAFPESLQLSGGQRVLFLVREMLEKHPDLSTYEVGESWGGDQPEEVHRLYLDVLLREIAETLYSAFSGSWDADIKHFDLPIGGGSSTVRTPMRDGVEIPWQKMSEVFPESRSLQVFDDFNSHRTMVLPPGSRLAGGSGKLNRSLEIDNPFVTVKINIEWQLGTMQFGAELKKMCDISTEDPGPDMGYWTAQYLISLTADFKALKIGNPDMKVHKRWVDTMFREIQFKCDSELRWSQLKEAYQLYH